MTWTVAAYLAYLLTTVPLTIWVASTLSRNGRVFLADVFRGEEGLADAVNRLLVVGFYLINLGFVTLYLRGGGEVADLPGLLERLSVKIGTVLLVLGVLHFVNVLTFSSMRRRAHADARHQAMPPYPYSQYPAQPQR
ncbi:hypothetical protein [Aeromicrobium sp. A1-2]|uniref:hypothetical protein n=1 Tax=Aeromicrobium sp. A1-2 TaxID=2107713 RepID=UPI001C20063F|nr:hypothetical protein [Aeromicrobium sp. A1-2]